MAVEVHVEGQVAAGRMAEFAEAIEQYKDYAKTHDYAVPRVLLGLSGEMNTVRLVYDFDTAADYEAQELRTLRDEEYGEIAGRMGFADRTLHYSLYREI
jgi:hypothetical protein